MRTAIRVIPHDVGDVLCSCADCRVANHRPTQRLTDLFDAALQCRAMVHLSTTDQPEAVTALRAWCSTHRIELCRIPYDGGTMHRADLPNGGSIVVTEWR